jgi:hypothetical protein
LTLPTFVTKTTVGECSKWYRKGYVTVKWDENVTAYVICRSSVGLECSRATSLEQCEAVPPAVATDKLTAAKEAVAGYSPAVATGAAADVHGVVRASVAVTAVATIFVMM